MATIRFDPNRPEGVQAVVASFDLSGFSNFCNHPDHYATLAQLVAALFAQLHERFMGELDAFILGPDVKGGRVPEPDFIKYTGDGALLVWLEKAAGGFDESFGTALVASLRQFRQDLAGLVPKWEHAWHVANLPKTVRVGISTGLVYPLKAEGFGFFSGETLDYVGYCINLAVRLQNHCPEVGFLVHGALHPGLPGMEALIAVKMKGTQDEPVYAFAADIARVSERTFQLKFRKAG